MTWLMLALLIALCALCTALNNGVARTPALGFNTWNDFRCDNISAVNLKAVAAKVVELGLDKLGYRY